MNMRTKLLAVASVLASVVATAPADAAILIEGTGFWNSTTPTTAYTAPRRSFQFSFTVPDVIPVSGTTATTTDLGDFTYSLNGVVTADATSVTFFTLASRGLFDINFGGTTVSLFGVDIGSDGTVGPEGGYAFTSALNSALTPTGSGFVTVSQVDDIPAVPEPASWALMIGGAGMVGGAMRRRQKVNVAVTYA